MTIQASVNNTPATGAVAMYQFKEALKAAGWTVPRSSDGTTYNNAGDQITSGASGAGGFANNSAWVELVQPGGGRAIIIQRGTTNLVWRVKYCATGAFTGGSPSATQTPAAAGDEATPHGGGTDASPTFATLFAADGSYRWHVLAEDATPVGGTGLGLAYFFAAFSTITATGVRGTALCLFPLEPDSYPPETTSRTSPATGDADPVVLHIGFEAAGAMWIMGGGGTAWNNSTLASNIPSGFYQLNRGGETFVRYQGFYYEGNTANSDRANNDGGANAGMGTDPDDNADLGLPVLVGRGARFATQTGRKGFLHYLKLRVTSRQYPDTVNLASGSYIYLGDFLIKWADTVNPAL